MVAKIRCNFVAIPIGENGEEKLSLMGAIAGTYTTLPHFLRYLLSKRAQPGVTYAVWYVRGEWGAEWVRAGEWGAEWHRCASTWTAAERAPILPSA